MWKAFPWDFSSQRRTEKGISIELIVASVASPIKIPGFLVDELAESRTWDHNMDNSDSIADAGVGPAGNHVSGTGNDC